MNIISLHTLTHNPSEAIITTDGKIFCIALKGLSRIKNSSGLYSNNLIEYLLNQTNLKIENIDKFVIDKVVKFNTKKYFLDKTN